MYIIIFTASLITVIIILIVIQRNYNEKGSTLISDNHFQLKNRVLNDSEQALYINLQKYLGENFIILSKVRIEDFIEATGKGLTHNERYGLRNRIKSRHIDFLICDLVSTEPLMAIELDGPSHKNKTERDNFINFLYKDVGLPIHHIVVGANFAEESLKIKDLLKAKNKK